MPIDATLLEILACPLCKTRVVEVGETLCCGNGECRHRYPVREGIPVMLVDESDVLPEDEWGRTVQPLLAK
ncbi:MAG TPA: Trm112 family protein [Candidatus Sumerlaeota bacterium]|nr:Trm112 family protein [Candidatus Sumerlaeota bacterium]HPS02158.1 Trm112 family protein [Candidatus Sumerlaeota bacterium]